MQNYTFLTNPPLLCTSISSSGLAPQPPTNSLENQVTLRPSHPHTPWPGSHHPTGVLLSQGLVYCAPLSILTATTLHWHQLRITLPLHWQSKIASAGTPASRNHLAYIHEQLLTELSKHAKLLL